MGEIEELVIADELAFCQVLIDISAEVIICDHTLPGDEDHLFVLLPPDGKRHEVVLGPGDPGLSGRNPRPGFP